MKTGTVVFIYRSEGWHMSRLLGVLGDRIEVEHIDGTREIYSIRRIARTSGKVVSSLAALEAYRQQVDALIQSFQPDVVWGLALDSGAADEALAPDVLASLVLPPAEFAADDAAAEALYNDRTYFRSDKKGGYFALSPDIVRVRLKEREEEARKLMQYNAMLAWLNEPTEEITPAANQAFEVLQSFVLFEDGSESSKTARQLIRDLFPNSSEPDISLAFKELVRHGVFSDDENLVFHRSGLPVAFSLGALRDAEIRSHTAVTSERREDHRHLLTVAIDDRYTTEIDDALSVESRSDGTWLVHVYIADASFFVLPGSPTDQDAFERASTIYLPEGKVPMLPDCLCEDAASLKSGVDRAAIDFSFTVDGEGNVLGFDIAEVLVNVNEHLSYGMSDELIAGTREHPLGELVRTLFSLGEGVRARRRQGGSITLDRQDTTVVVGENRIAQVTPWRTDDPSRRMVAEWMISACTGAARWCYDHRIPTLYRAQRPPDDPPQIPLDRPLRGFELQRILRTMRKAELSIEPLPHAGLGVDFYTQITSPLRRYADLLMHRQIRSVLRTSRPYYSENELLQYFEQIEHITAQQRSIERQSRRFWVLRRLEQNIGHKVEVEVVRQIGRRFVVDLLDWGLQCAWTPKRTPTVGDILPLTISQVNARKDRIILAG